MPVIDDHVVFIAGASDTVEFKTVAQDVITEINQSWGEVVPFRVIGKTASELQPGKGDYPQQVINKQISGRTDTFTGLLKSKNGKATLNYRSGTSEEIFSALRENRSSGKPDILIYKIDIPSNTSKILLDPRLADLIEELSREGVLYHKVDSRLNFERKYRIHLVNAIRDRADRGLRLRGEFKQEQGAASENADRKDSFSETNEEAYRKQFFDIASWAARIIPLGFPYLQRLTESFYELSMELESVIQFYVQSGTRKNSRVENRVLSRLALRFESSSTSTKDEGRLFHLYVGLGLLVLDISSKGAFKELLSNDNGLRRTVDHFVLQINDQLKSIEDAYSNLPETIRALRFRERSQINKSSMRFRSKLQKFLQVNRIIISFIEIHYEAELYRRREERNS